MSKQKYILMHKDIPVCKCSFEDDYFMGVDFVMNKEHLPVGTHNYRGFADEGNLRAWFAHREVSANRSNVKQVDSTLHGLSHTRLMLMSNCANLSDQYWMKEEGTDLTWKDVNFFENDFNKNLGDIMMQDAPDITLSTKELISPDSAAQGNLPKSWRIINGERFLLKGSTVSRQEPLNEVIASNILRRADIDHVPYKLMLHNGHVVSACPCIVNENHEIVSAMSLMADYNRLAKGPLEEVEEYRKKLHELDIPDSDKKLDQMILMDILMQNTDRHWTNFGLIRNSETLKYEDVCPMFDFGNSLYFTGPVNERQVAVSQLTHQSLEDDINCVKDIHAIPVEIYESFGDIASSVIEKSPELARSRKIELSEAAGNRGNMMIRMCYPGYQDEKVKEGGVQYEND